MKIPDEIKIGGLVYKIIIGEDIPNYGGVFGAFVGTRQKIYIDSRETQRKQEHTFLHEILHAVIWDCGLGERLKNSEIKEEEIVCALTGSLYQVLKDNIYLKYE